jgi:ketosteroid isomerase-like protein
MSPDEIEKRFKVLEDIEAIRQLKVRYCHLVDAYDAEGIAALFTDDAVFDAGQRGRRKGKQELLEFFKGAKERLPFFVHMVLNPLIEVNGDTAKGSWYLFQASTLGETNEAVWGSGRYDDEYVKVSGYWMFKNVNLNLFFWTPFDQGWVKKRFA